MCVYHLYQCPLCQTMYREFHKQCANPVPVSQSDKTCVSKAVVSAPSASRECNSCYDPVRREEARRSANAVPNTASTGSWSSSSALVRHLNSSSAAFTDHVQRRSTSRASSRSRTPRPVAVEPDSIMFTSSGIQHEAADGRAAEDVFSGMDASNARDPTVPSSRSEEGPAGTLSHNGNWHVKGLESEGALRAQSQELQSILGSGQMYIRPSWFEKPFNADTGDSPDTRYGEVVAKFPRYLNPLDYESRDAFAARMHNIWRQKGSPPLGTLKWTSVYSDWIGKIDNWPFLRHEDGHWIRKSDPPWPAHILKDLGEPARLLDPNGHFIPHAKWFGDGYIQKRTADARYHFAYIIASHDDRVLPYELFAQFIDRQQTCCNSKKSREQLKEAYVAWQSDARHKSILPMIWGAKGKYIHKDPEASG